MQRPTEATTGIAPLDTLLRGIEPGDNIVWQVEAIDDYQGFAVPFAHAAIRDGFPVIYFRFARHAPLLAPQDGLRIHEVNPHAGFESFIDTIHAAIAEAGRGAHYVFDCLSDLAADWFSDQMLGNFFMVTCPYLYDLDTVAYFALLRDYHADSATAPIRKTTQLLIDLFRHDAATYVRPIKVRQKFFPTMHMLHRLTPKGYVPITESHILADVLAKPGGSTACVPVVLDVWNRAFLQAEDMLAAGGAAPPAKQDALFKRLLRMVISRDPRVLALAEENLTLAAVAAIGRRTLGTGLIGGKTVGMLLARAILLRNDPAWEERLETHDSFFIASDVFYTFLVENGCWWIRKQQQQSATCLDGASQARRRILSGRFSHTMRERFRQMLEYFGRAPIIVRSSSLLEDNFGNAFAGKYDSVFCANQGAPDQRLEEFLSAVKTVYASSMSEAALAYRARYGILHLDEQMALLVQRVSGSNHGRLFFPHVGGVGFSFNPYRWSEAIDPEAGLLRLVMGLGTRAVDRSDAEYTRIIALNAPDRRPEGAPGDRPPLAQHSVDTIDLEENTWRRVSVDEALAAHNDIPLDLLAPRQTTLQRRMRQQNAHSAAPRLITFEGLVRHTRFIQDLRALLTTLDAAYCCPVDVEFAATFFDDNTYKLNLLQCRPLQVCSRGEQTALPENVPQQNILAQSTGPVIGRSRTTPVHRIIYVAPAAYAGLSLQDRHALARFLGTLTHAPAPADAVGGSLFLAGPGRWATSSPELGIPVHFAEIATVNIICEIVAMREDLVPDVSMGTHFFSELVEADMLYLAVFPGQQGHQVDFTGLRPTPLADIAGPGAARWDSVVHVYDPQGAQFYADTVGQRVLFYQP
ncbi:MAG: PEP/pyruvate-binding domain-containing protein [Candidatus Hydrogenedentota bacterium]